MNPALLRVLNSRINSWCRRSTPCSWICWCRHPAAWRGRMQSPKTPNLSGCPCRPGRKDEIYHQQSKRTRLIGMYPCYLVQDEWSPRVSLAGVSSSLGKACNNNCATFNHPLTLEPAHQRIYGEKTHQHRGRHLCRSFPSCCCCRTNLGICCCLSPKEDTTVEGDHVLVIQAEICG